MAKHPLLPDSYPDKILQTTILFALRPYKVTDRSDISNPHLKWNLQKAWEDAKALLVRGGWKHRVSADGSEIGCELVADTETEIAELNIVIAGIIARQIMCPEEELHLHRIEYKKGGEMVMAVSNDVMDKLKTRFPALLLSDNAKKDENKKYGFLRWKKWIKK